MATTRTRDYRSSGPPPKGRTPSGGSGGGRRRKKRNIWLVRLQIFFTFILVAIFAGLLGTVWALARIIKELPDSTTNIENFLPAGRSLIYSSDGILLAQLTSQNRQTVTIDNIPKNLQNATVAIEDSRFYSNHGVDIRGITRALFHNIQSGDSSGQGGSTITQQLVRNLGIDGIGHEKTFSRKIREAVYAFKIDQNFSKQQILEMYLNQVYYGSGAYGVQAAAETYFGKPAAQIDLAQCAMIAGLPQRPSGYSPYTNKKAATDRRNTVLGRMRDLHYISADECAAAQSEPIILAFPKPPTTSSKIYHAPYFVNYVVHSLTVKYGSDLILRGGLTITTTLNYQMQSAAEDAVAKGISSASYLGVTDAALVAMDQRTGYIKAMVGGLDYTKSQFNIAADGHRQPGSSFKPVIYTAALDSGLITENTTISNEPLSLPGANGKAWSPKNDPGVGSSTYRPTAKYAVQWSINRPAVRLLREVGVDTAIHYASMMGIKSPLEPYLTLALGSSAVTPLEMCRMYALIANQGELPTPTGVLKIVQSDGTPLEEDQPILETTSISVSALSQMGDMLRAVVTDGTASNVFRDNNPSDAHGKTGTTQEHRDVWFDGYTSKLTCVVWAGHPSIDPKSGKPVYLPMNGVAFGATICAPIWKQFMVSANSIMAAEAAREAALAKPAVAQAPPAVTTTQLTTAPLATATKTTSTSTTPALSSAATDADDPTAELSPDGKSVTVWIDDATGLRATPNATGAHQSVFVTGTEPMTYADGSAVTASPAHTTSAKSATSSATAPASAPTPTTATPAAPSQPAAKPAQPAVVTTTPAPPKMVTVTICVETGLRATEWCPETIEKQFPANQIPKYCTLHKPPPGE